MDSRKAIAAKALSLFADRGYDAVGVAEIVDAAGLTKPTLYHFFGSKQGLLETLFREHAAVLDDRVARATAYSGDLPRSLGQVAEAYTGYAAGSPDAYRLELALYFAPSGNPAHAVAASHYARRQKLLEGLFRDATADHGNLRDRERRYAVSFVGVLNSFIGLQLGGQIALSDRLCREIVHQFSHGIYS